MFVNVAANVAHTAPDPARGEERMKLQRTTFRSDPAYLWTAPNGTPFYLQQTYTARKWVWWRGEADHVSSAPFPTLDEIKAHLRQAFEEE